MSFIAGYPGVCANGCDGIQPGDRITRCRERSGQQGYRHVGPCPERDDLVVVRQPCSACFQVPAANGTCGCEG